MKPIDRQTFEEQRRLVSRYVAGDLSRSECAEFEAWLIASPELAAEVGLDDAYRCPPPTMTRCSIDVIVRHELQGRIDPAFDHGIAVGIVSRKVALDYVPR